LHYQDATEEEIEELAEYCESEFDRISDAAGYIPNDKIVIFIKKEKGFGSAQILKPKEMRSMKFDLNILQERDRIYETVTLLISQLIISDIFGGSKVTSAVRLPQWFVYGAALYIANYRARRKISFDHVLSTPVGNLKKLRGMDAMVGGAKVFNCIESFNESSVKNVINLTQILRDEKKAISNTVGMNYESFLESCSFGPDQ
jgi:hypothetical protein